MFERVVVGTAEWDELTSQRAKLIYKKNREGLSPEEAEQFVYLQKVSREAICAAFPAGLSELEKCCDNTGKST
jgi:hypothetical protein